MEVLEIVTAESEGIIIDSSLFFFHCSQIGKKTFPASEPPTALDSPAHSCIHSFIYSLIPSVRQIFNEQLLSARHILDTEEPAISKTEPKPCLKELIEDTYGNDHLPRARHELNTCPSLLARGISAIKSLARGIPQPDFKSTPAT